MGFAAVCLSCKMRNIHDSTNLSRDIGLTGKLLAGLVCETRYLSTHQSLPSPHPIFSIESKLSSFAISINSEKQEPRHHPVDVSGVRVVTYKSKIASARANQYTRLDSSLWLPTILALFSLCPGLYAGVHLFPMSPLASKYAHIALFAIIHPPLVYIM